jgi:AraC-like DNA-binding protein
MTSNEPREQIVVWRPHDLTQLELRRGVADTRLVPRHWHEEYQFCVVQFGGGELKYRRRDFPTPPASLFMVHPGEVHSNRPHEGFGCSYRMILVSADVVRRAAAEVIKTESELPFLATAVTFDQDVIQQYLDLYSALEKPSSRLEREALLLNLLTGLIIRFAENRPPPPAYKLERQAIKRACDYLVEHYAENVSLERLAQIANLSPFHFHRVFAEQVGMPPHAYQTQVRVARAKALLLQGWSIPQAAALTGFTDQSHFTRHFKRLVTVPPGVYLQNSKNVQDNI